MMKKPRSTRPPGAEAGHSLDSAIAAEKAASLGRAGRRVERRLAELAAAAGSSEERERRLAEAAEAVQAYFVQRETMGLRRHEAVIEAYGIPRQVLVRLGAG